MPNEAIQRLSGAIDEYSHAVCELSHAIRLIGQLYPSSRDNPEVRGYVERALAALKEAQRIMDEE